MEDFLVIEISFTILDNPSPMKAVFSQINPFLLSQLFLSDDPRVSNSLLTLDDLVPFTNRFPPKNPFQSEDLPASNRLLILDGVFSRTSRFSREGRLYIEDLPTPSRPLNQSFLIGDSTLMKSIGSSLFINKP